MGSSLLGPFHTAPFPFQVIRHKIAEMSAKIELVHSYLETLAFQMKRGRVEQIGGEIALAKVQATKSMLGFLSYCLYYLLHSSSPCTPI